MVYVSAKYFIAKKGLKSTCRLPPLSTLWNAPGVLCDRFDIQIEPNNPFLKIVTSRPVCLVINKGYLFVYTDEKTNFGYALDVREASCVNIYQFSVSLHFLNSEITLGFLHGALYDAWCQLLSAIGDRKVNQHSALIIAQQYAPLVLDGNLDVIAEDDGDQVVVKISEDEDFDEPILNSLPQAPPRSQGRHYRQEFEAFPFSPLAGGAPAKRSQYRDSTPRTPLRKVDEWFAPGRKNSPQDFYKARAPPNSSVSHYGQDFDGFLFAFLNSPPNLHVPEDFCFAPLASGTPIKRSQYGAPTQWFSTAENPHNVTYSKISYATDNNSNSPHASGRRGRNQPSQAEQPCPVPFDGEEPMEED